MGLSVSTCVEMIKFIKSHTGQQVLTRIHLERINYGDERDLCTQKEPIDRETAFLPAPTCTCSGDTVRHPERAKNNEKINQLIFLTPQKKLRIDEFLTAAYDGGRGNHGR